MNRTRLAASALLCAALAVPAPASAQVEVERRRAAPARGEVSVDSAFGAIVVRAWEKAEVLVKGTVAAGAEGLDFDGDKEGTSISVDVPESWLHAAGEDEAFRSNLEVWAPVGSGISVESINAAVIIEGFSGGIEVSTINGYVQVTGAPESVEIETMTGRVEVRTAPAPMDIRSVSGSVLAIGATGEVKIETVSGGVELTGAGLAKVEVKTTTGPVSLVGRSLARAGGIEVETFSSPVKLLLPKSARAAFRLQTFGGKIQSAFCAGTPVVRERFEPFRQLRCSTGPDEFEIQVRTHDADITVSTE